MLYINDFNQALFAKFDNLSDQELINVIIDGECDTPHYSYFIGWWSSDKCYGFRSL